jgi:hypothetical protein
MHAAAGPRPTSKPSLHSKRQLGPALALSVASLLLFAALTIPLRAEGRPDRRCKVVVTAFVGGIGTAHFPPSVAVPLLHHVRALRWPGVCVKQFSAYCPWCAHHWLRRSFTGSRKRPPTEEELESGPRVILYGYSLGAPSALHLARQLERDGISIELTITVDSKGFTQGIVPRNVKIAANFYEKGLVSFVSGKNDIRPEDPQATDFLGNIRLNRVGHLTIAASIEKTRKAAVAAQTLQCRSYTSPDLK